MSEKTTSLDIQEGKGSILDIASVFPMTQTRALDLARHGAPIDGIVAGEDYDIDISQDAIIRITRFRTIETLDVALPEIVAPASWQRRFLAATPRSRKIDIVPPLYVPYGSLDIRGEKKISRKNLEKEGSIPYSGKIDLTSKTTKSLRTTGIGEKLLYPDIFARQLPYGLLTRRFFKGVRNFMITRQKKIYLGIVGFLVFSIPVLSYVAYAINHGYTTLGQIAETRDPAIIRTMIRTARGDFERSNFLFAPFSWIPLDRVDVVQRASAGGLALTRGLDIIAQALPSTMDNSGSTIKKDIEDPLSYRAAARDIFLTESLGIANPTDWIEENESILKQARDELMRAGDIYSGIVPTGARTLQMQSVGKTLSKLSGILDWSLKNQKDILNMLGHTNPQRYIVFNQNRDEIRANGGFPGSILSFTIYKGNILDYHGDDVYYYDWNLYPYKEIPPPGIALLTDNYGLRDVNYYPDFHETLDKANRFIERSGDATVTTGIAIHQGIVEDMLAKIGPVTVSGVTLPFDEKNFSLLMSTLVEGKYAKENTPKDVLFRFISAFVTKVGKENKIPELLDIASSYIKDGEILFASRDAEVDGFLANYRKKLPWELASPNWIYPVWTSVSGNKSDRYITRTYRAETQRLDECIYENTITLSTTHTLKESDQEELKSYFQLFGITDPAEKSKLDFIQGNGKNRAYVRVFVPLGSTVVGAGSDIITTSNISATAFSILMETPVGTTTSKSWKYTLNIPNCVNYDGKIEWTKQPGLREVIVK